METHSQLAHILHIATAWNGGHPAHPRSDQLTGTLATRTVPPAERKRAGLVRAWAWLLMGFLWITEAVTHAHTISSPDGISYLDIARECMRGHWDALLNAYWSPAYPFLLAIWLSVFRPSPYWEAFAVHCLNCLLAAAALLSFEFFLAALAHSAHEEPESLPTIPLRIFGYTLFCWILAGQNPPAVLTDSPDILVLCAVLLASGILIRIETGEDGWSRFALLGAVLGLGYLAKAAMLPLGFVFLAAAWLAIVRRRTPNVRLIAAVALFILIAASFVLPLSKREHRFTFSDSGAINYAEFVNGARHNAHWRGAPKGTGSPLHPTRMLLDNPVVYEYASPIGGSYPPWTDPSYWYAGISPHFDLKNQLAALYRSSTYIFQAFRLLSPLAAGFLVLWLFIDHQGFQTNLLNNSYLWLPAVLGLAMYSCVLIQPRYIAPFILLIWAAAFSALRLPSSPPTQAILRCVLIIVCISLGSQVAGTLADNIGDLSADRAAPDWRLARALAADGINHGDKVAFVGRAIDDHYWAHLADVTIGSEIGEEGEQPFWTSSPQIRARAIRTLISTGAHAVIAHNVPGPIQPEGWQRVPNTAYYILIKR